MLDNRKRNTMLILKIVCYIILQLVFIYGLIANIVNIIVFLIAPPVRKFGVWDYMHLFVIVIMIISLIFSVAKTKYCIKSLPE